MTLFIACILIHQFGMAWWWYLAAAVIWSGCVLLQVWWTMEDGPGRGRPRMRL
jgi:hypothetical protein